MLTAEQIKSAYGRVLIETVTVRRYTGTGSNRPYFDAAARGKTAVSVSANALTGTVQQGQQTVFVYADDLVAAGFVLPLTTADKVVVRGKEYQIITPGERRAPDGALVAYELTVKG